MNEDGQTESLTPTETTTSDDLKPKRNSRWVAGSGVPRYDKKTLDTITDQYGEEAGWHRAARIAK